MAVGVGVVERLELGRRELLDVVVLGPRAVAARPVVRAAAGRVGRLFLGRARAPLGLRQPLGELVDPRLLRLGARVARGRGEAVGAAETLHADSFVGPEHRSKRCPSSHARLKDMSSGVRLIPWPGSGGVGMHASIGPGGHEYGGTAAPVVMGAGGHRYATAAVGTHGY